MTPTRAQPVVIRLPDGELPARVDTADAASMTLVLSVPPNARLERAPAIVEWYTPTGIHRIAGELGSDGADTSVLRLVREGEEHVQRREWARVDAAVPVEVRFEAPAAGLAATVTLNVSGGGALIRDPVGLELGTEVTVELHLDGAPIAASGRVVRETGEGAKGIELTGVAHGDRERLVRFVTVRQIDELRLRGRR